MSPEQCGVQFPIGGPGEEACILHQLRPFFARIKSRLMTSKSGHFAKTRCGGAWMGEDRLQFLLIFEIRNVPRSATRGRVFPHTSTQGGCKSWTLQGGFKSWSATMMWASPFCGQKGALSAAWGARLNNPNWSDIFSKSKFCSGILRHRE